MSALNQEAPPLTAAPSKDFIKFDVFPKSDSYPLTYVGIDFIQSYDFKRKDEKTGEEYIKPGPGVVFFLGTIVNGKPHFVKTWPQSYSDNEKSNYYKHYEAACGIPPKAGTKANDVIGKVVLGNVKVEEKKSAKGTAYKVSSLKSVLPLPSFMAAACTPLKDLLPAFEIALKGEDKKEEGPF
jgi:hypothetical protein